ncbi:hypothetical protein ABPG75_010818 [Micractinium tetrahymenae]
MPPPFLQPGQQQACSAVERCRCVTNPCCLHLSYAARVTAYGEGAIALVDSGEEGGQSFVVDESQRLGGMGLGPNPLQLLLGALIGCTQYTASMIAKERGLPAGLGAMTWEADGDLDLRGVRGDTPGVDARFRRIALKGTLDTELEQRELDSLAGQIEARCVVASTLKASGMDLSLALHKGAVDHSCQPACQLHALSGRGGRGQGHAVPSGLKSAKLLSVERTDGGGEAAPGQQG